MHEYPIDLVLNLHRAALENWKVDLEIRTRLRKTELINQIYGVAAVLTAAISGKGEHLQNWLKAMADPDMETKEPEKTSRRKSKLSPAAIAFFSGLPQKTKG